MFEHIVKQIIRFIVAYQNQETRKQLRDLFLNVIKEDRENYLTIFQKYSSDVREIDIYERLEEIIDTKPELYIFIDHIDEDLKDFCLILKSSIEIKVIEIIKSQINNKFIYIFNDDEYTFSIMEPEPTEESHATNVYRKIFNELIEIFKKSRPDSTKRGTTGDSWLEIPVGTTGFHVQWHFTGREPEKAISIELNFINSNQNVNHKAFDFFEDKEKEIRDLFEEEVHFEKYWRKKGEWSSIYFSKDIETLNKFLTDDDLKKWALDNMIKLYDFYMKYAEDVKTIINTIIT